MAPLLNTVLRNAPFSMLTIVKYIGIKRARLIFKLLMFFMAIIRFYIGILTRILRIFGFKRSPTVMEEILLYPAKVITEKILSRETAERNSTDPVAVRGGSRSFGCAYDLVKLPVKSSREEPQISCLAVTEAYINRIREVNPIINAVVEDRYLDAIQEAKKVDQLVVNCKMSPSELKLRYPLLGCPMTVKESIAVEGMSHGAGHPTLMKKRKATEDADAVHLCRKAGAIILAVTNTSPLCMGFECSNLVTGITKNPYDTRRSPGGSTGGDAALVASAGSIIGLGSDLMGCLRIPASHCGISSHKPTAYTVSNHGNYPWIKNDSKVLESLHCIGPLARYACDLSDILNVIIKPEEKALMELHGDICLDDIKIHYLKEYKKMEYTRKPTYEVSEGIKSLIRHFKSVCNTKEIEVDELKKADYIVFNTLVNLPFLDLNIDMLTKQIINAPLIGYKLARGNADCLNDLVYELKTKLMRILGDNGVLLFPTFPSSAPYRGSGAIDFGYTGIFNVLGFPSTTCPLGKDKKGLPFGIQIVAAPYKDKLTLTVAEEIEKRFCSWSCPGETCLPSPPNLRIKGSRSNGYN